MAATMMMRITPIRTIVVGASSCAAASSPLRSNICRRWDISSSACWRITAVTSDPPFSMFWMVVNQLIRRVDVYRGYQINISFNFDLTPYIEGE